MDIPLKGVLFMYNNHGREMRLLSHPIILLCMMLVSLTPHAHVGIVLLIAAEMIAIWGTLPDMRSVCLQIIRSFVDEFGEHW